MTHCIRYLTCLLRADDRVLPHSVHTICTDSDLFLALRPSIDRRPHNLVPLVKDCHSLQPSQPSLLFPPTLRCSVLLEELPLGLAALERRWPRRTASHQPQERERVRTWESGLPRCAWPAPGSRQALSHGPTPALSIPAPSPNMYFPPGSPCTTNHRSFEICGKGGCTPMLPLEEFCG